MKRLISRITVAAPESAQEALALACGNTDSVNASQDFQSMGGVDPDPVMKSVPGVINLRWS